MVRLSLFTIVMFVGLTMVIAKSEHQKRFSRSSEQLRSLRNLMGKLIDTEANAIYAVDGQKQQNAPVRSDTKIPSVPAVPFSSPKQEEMACLAACHSCLEGYPITSRKKKNDDNCGVMCDCADSCFLMPVEQVGEIYSQLSSAHNGKDCWWRTYTSIHNNKK